MELFFIFFAAVFDLGKSLVSKSVTLLPSISDIKAINGVSAKCMHYDCRIKTNPIRWDITASDSLGFHMQIDLDNTWGFHPHKPSTITFTFHSNSLVPAEDDLDPLFIFSVNSTKYITYWLSYDYQNPNFIYPAHIDDVHSNLDCDSHLSNHLTQSLGSGDIKSIVNQSTYKGWEDRGAKATDGGNWGYIIPRNNSTNMSFPTTITVTNDPIKDQTFTTITWNTSYIQGCGYADSFDTDKGLQIFIALDDPYEAISFTQFDITYQYEEDPTTTLVTLPPIQNQTRTDKPIAPEYDTVKIGIITGCSIAIFCCVAAVFVLIIYHFGKRNENKSIEEKIKVSIGMDDIGVIDHGPGSGNDAKDDVKFLDSPREVGIIERDGPMTNGIGQIVNEEDVVVDNVNTVELMEVQIWLETNVKLSMYYETFIENGYESLDIIKEIQNEEELQEIGITSKEHRVQVLNAVKDLNLIENQEGVETEQHVTQMIQENRERDGSHGDHITNC